VNLFKMVSIVYVRGRAGGEASGPVGHAGTHAAQQRRRGDGRRALGPLRGALAVGHVEVAEGAMPAQMAGDMSMMRWTARVKSLRG